MSEKAAVKGFDRFMASFPDSSPSSRERCCPTRAVNRSSASNFSFMMASSLECSFSIFLNRAACRLESRPFSSARRYKLRFLNRALRASRERPGGLSRWPCRYGRVVFTFKLQVFCGQSFQLRPHFGGQSLDACNARGSDGDCWCGSGRAGYSQDSRQECVQHWPSRSSQCVTTSGWAGEDERWVALDCLQPDNYI